MKIEGFEKASSAKIHPHNRCSICSGNVRSKSGVRQKVKREIKKQIASWRNAISPVS